MMRVDDKWLAKVADYTARDLGLQDTADGGKRVLDLIADLREARQVLVEIGDCAEAAFENASDSAQALKALRNLSKRARGAIAVQCPTCGQAQPPAISSQIEEK